MAGEQKNVMQCAEFDALLSETLDGNSTATSDPQKRSDFLAHSRTCSVCGPLLADAESGRRWLKTLASIEPPDRLTENILLATTGLDSHRLRAGSATGFRSPVFTEPFFERAREWVRGAARTAWGGARQPRFAMSFAMAFFSLSLVLSLAGVRLGSLNLRPSAIKRSYYETSGRVVKHYENIRFVYEIESRVQEFKRANNPAPPPEGGGKRKGDTSEHPQQNLRSDQSPPVLAESPEIPDVVGMPDADRRLS